MAYQTRTYNTGRGQEQQQPQVVYRYAQAQPQNVGMEEMKPTPISSCPAYGEQQQLQPAQETESMKMESEAKTDQEFEDLPDEGNDKEAAQARRLHWIRRRRSDPLFKVSKKVKRKRMNARLRHILQPKNAAMVLNEFFENVKFTSVDQTNSVYQNGFVFNVEVDGRTFTGDGISKAAAKQSAAENALKALLLEKMATSAEQSSADADVVMKDDQEVAATASDVPPGEEPPLLDADGKPVTRKGPNIPEDDVPWGGLASYALYKLFNHWQNQGLQLPVAKTGPTTNPEPAVVLGGGRPGPMKKLPDNPTEKHPVMLLGQLCPQLVYAEVGVQGLSPNLVFTTSVTIDGTVFQGMGKNKKEAKKEAAKSALSTLYNINYEN